MILGIQEWTSHMYTKRTSCWDGETYLKSLKKRELWSANIMVVGQKTVQTHPWSVESDSILQLKTSNFKFLHFSRVERLSLLLISVTTWNLFQVICFRSYKQYQRGVPAPEGRLLRALSLNDINKAYVMHWKSNISFSLHPKYCSDNWNTIKVTKSMPIPQHGNWSRNTAAGKTGWRLHKRKVYSFRKPSLWRFWRCQLKGNSTYKYHLTDWRINFLWIMLSLGQHSHTRVNHRNIPFAEMSG